MRSMCPRASMYLCLPVVCDVILLLYDSVAGAGERCAQRSNTSRSSFCGHALLGFAASRFKGSRALTGWRDL
ncbi:hypothetical protein C2E23DRAFT_798576 [Lenzites betulinus]|nr:hypothetical protein C2E23DRAFT_798576 [Lenzites betulinus]